MPTIEIADGVTIDVPDAPFGEAEREALAWREPGLPSEWAEQHRELREDEADEAGPWRNFKAPYLRGFMDLSTTPGVERVVVEKAAQIGVSEACRILLGYWAESDPGPHALALPNKVKGEQIVERKVLPLFRRTPALRRLLTERAHDQKKAEIALANPFVLYLMWSGSPSSTASHPIKRALSDETNKHAAWKGVETDPIDSVDKRLRTYSDSLHVLVSTPTTRAGTISREFDETTHQLYFLVPCPHCGVRQRLVFPQVVIPEPHEEESTSEYAQRVVREESCFYRCAACEGEIDEKARRRIVVEGKWGTVDENMVIGDGRIEDAEAVEEFPPGTRIGMQVSALYCLWRSISFSRIGAEWIRARHDRRALFTFRTETCGERWEQQTERLKANVFARKSQEAHLAEGVLPWWTHRVALTVDTQADYFWVVARAWGPGLLSQRVAHGIAESFEELRMWLAASWPHEGQWIPPRKPSVMLIDTGGTTVGEERASRTQQVYAFAIDNRKRVLPIKGASKPRDTGELYWAGKGVYQGGNDGKKQEIRLWMLDVHQSQEILAEHISEQVEVPDEQETTLADQWRLNNRNDAEYNGHMSNMHKVQQPEGADLVERWVPVQDGVRVDYRHCEGYQIAAAYMLRIHQLPDLETWKQQTKAEVEAMQRPRQNTGMRTPDGRPFFVTER